MILTILIHSERKACGDWRGVRGKKERIMQEMIGYCGYNCHLCAARSEDPAVRQQLGLDDTPTVTASYIAMVADHLADAGGVHLGF